MPASRPSRRPAPRPLPAVALGALAALAPAAAGAQRAPAADSVARADSARAQALAPVTVTVTRTPTARDRAPWAVDVVDTRALRRGRATVGLDEALADVPGVYVANRYNFSVDQRLSIRGFGSRANFGVRGVRVLLDGVPQTLPDGQSQLTNIDLGNVGRVEVLRGAASSLYGNASGGVLAFTTDLETPTRFTSEVRATSGAFGMDKWQVRAVGRSGATVASLSASRLAIAGFRQHSAAEQRRLSLAVDRALGTGTTASLRLHLAEDPRARNPGALTVAEYRARRDSAAGANILRGADKRVDQQQLSLGLRHEGAHGLRLDATVFALARDLWNPLATPPPRSTAPDVGTLAAIDRGVAGARVAAARALPWWGDAARAPRLAVGAELQRMRDARRNQRTTRGRTSAPTDTLLLDQVERVTNLAPFAQLTWEPAARVLLDAGVRRDRVRFAVADRFTGDGLDNSGARTMAATSGHVGVSVAASRAFAPYANLATSFETPTTTELQATSTAIGGFNPDLAPQRARSAELGARGAFGGAAATRVQWSAALFRTRVENAIVQWTEVNGRAFFRNAGSTRNTGAELGVAVRPVELVTLRGSYTWARYRFADYRIRSGATVDTLDGRTLPGAPERFARFGVRTGPWKGATLDVDHTWSSALYADDRNALRVDSWGSGALDARLAVDLPVLRGAVRPFVAVQNALDARYVGSVTVNGAFGRVLEPAPGRTFYLGTEVGWRSAR